MRLPTGASDSLVRRVGHLLTYGAAVSCPFVYGLDGLGDQVATMLSQHLRTLALRAISHSRESFDLRAAERFRLLADDLLAQAIELEQENADGVSISLPKTKLRGRPTYGD